MQRTLRGRWSILLPSVPILLVAVLAVTVPTFHVESATRSSAQPGSPEPSHANRADTGRKIFVAKAGRASASGTQQDPADSIGRGLSKARPGDTVVVGPGIYHESLKVENRDGLVVEAAPGAQVWLDGSIALGGWTQEGSAWQTSNWREHFDASPTYTFGRSDNDRDGWRFLDPRYPMAAHPEQVWVDGKPQRQVGSLAQIDAGSFYVDTRNRKLYLGSNPRGREVTASTLQQALRIRSNSVEVRDIGIRKYAPSVPHMGAVTIEAANVLLSHVSIIESATTGLHVMEQNATLDHVTVAKNGMMGMTATNAPQLVLDHVVARRNNLEHFNRAPSAGGVKIGRTSGVEVRDSVFSDNLGTGLWFDDSVYDIGVLHSRSENNAGHGVIVEMSGKAALIDNVIARNHENGLKINDSDDVQVWNNTFVDNKRSINILQDDRDLHPEGSYRDAALPLTFQVRDVTVRNNILSGSSGNCLLGLEDFSGRFRAAELNVTAAGNVYQRDNAQSPRWLVVWARGEKDPYVFRSLSRFRDTVGQEAPGAYFTRTKAVTSSGKPTGVVSDAVHSVAQPLPAALAARVGVSQDFKRLGAWTT